MQLGQTRLPPSRSREGSGVGIVPGTRRPTNRAQTLRRDATPAERKLWSALGASKCGAKFSRQMPVGSYIRFSNAEEMGNLNGVVATIRAAPAEQTHPRPLPQAGGKL